MADLRIEALDYARKLTAALEQGATGDAAQFNRLEAHLIEARRKLTVLERATVRAVAILNGDPCVAPLPGESLSVIEEAALSAKGAARRADEIGRVQRELSEARAELDRARVVAQADLETLRSRDAQIDQMAADLAKLTSRASIAEATNRAKDKETAAAHDRVHQLEQVHDQQVVSLKATRDQVETLQRDSIRQQAAVNAAIAMMDGRRTSQLNQTEVNNKLLRTVSELMRVLESQPVKVNELRRQLAEANDTITKHADVIKELHRQYHELEARKMATQYDLDRAKEEIAFAEAEIAKYKPLTEAVRGGHSTVRRRPGGVCF